ncbi:MAG TPA: tyrosine-type recombinase/integrase [Acidimicrobiales bacterium]|nr:tyrosine-type recombinase/integrase [Acidimicrobiales bacterium]
MPGRGASSTGGPGRAALRRQSPAFSRTFDRRVRRPLFAGLPVLRLHDLCHTWATLALAAGVDVTIVARTLGHSSPATTWATYQHVVTGMQADAAEKVAALIFGA